MDEIVTEDVQAGAERALAEGQTGDLAVAAVDDGREEKQHGARHRGGRRAAREAPAAHDPDGDRGDGHLVRRDAGREEQAGQGPREPAVDDAREPTVARSPEPRVEPPFGLGATVGVAGIADERARRRRPGAGVGRRIERGRIARAEQRRQPGTVDRPECRRRRRGDAAAARRRWTSAATASGVLTVVALVTTTVGDRVAKPRRPGRRSTRSGSPAGAARAVGRGPRQSRRRAPARASPNAARSTRRRPPTTCSAPSATAITPSKGRAVAASGTDARIRRRRVGKRDRRARGAPRRSRSTGSRVRGDGSTPRPRESSRRARSASWSSR